MEESRGAKAANDSHFSRRRRWRLEYLAGNGCVVFPRLLGWVSTIVNGPTQHRRGRLDTAFSYEKAYETILTLTFTKQALRNLYKRSVQDPAYIFAPPTSCGQPHGEKALREACRDLSGRGYAVSCIWTSQNFSSTHSGE